MKGKNGDRGTNEEETVKIKKRKKQKEQKKTVSKQ